MSKLKEIRTTRNMRPEAVALAAGLSVSAVYNLEAGKTVPSLETARAIADALGVTVDEAFPPEPAAVPVKG